MNKLVLYSDQINGISDEIDKKLMQFLKSKKPKIGYIPSCSDPTREWFNQRVDHYKGLGIDELVYFDLDEEYDESKINELFHCEAIHLSGGDTFYFLSLLQQRNFLKKLRNYVKNGGILIGISAGSMIMSKTISSAELIDKNNIGLKDLKSLGLINFDFFPHWDDSNSLDDILEFSKNNNRKVCYVCRDSDGIIVENDNMIPIGSPIKIMDGKLL